MMLRIALRAHRNGFLVVAVLGFALAFIEGVGFAAAAGHTAAERAAFGKQMAEVAPQIAYLVPLPIHPETFAGYVQWPTYGTLSIVFGFWALMAATGAIRNEEERGLLETWLASGVGRLRLVAGRFAAFTTAAAAAVFRDRLEHAGCRRRHRRLDCGRSPHPGQNRTAGSDTRLLRDWPAGSAAPRHAPRRWAEPRCSRCSSWTA